MLKYDLTIVQGEDFAQDIYFKTNTNVYSLKGYTAKSQIRPKAGSNELTAEFVCKVYPNDGYIHMELDAQTIENIPAGTYQYDLLLTKSGSKAYYMGGKVYIEKHVTEP